MEKFQFGAQCVFTALDNSLFQNLHLSHLPIFSRNCLSFQIKILESRVTNPLAEGFKAYQVGKSYCGGCFAIDELYML